MLRYDRTAEPSGSLSPALNASPPYGLDFRVDGSEPARAYPKTCTHKGMDEEHLSGRM